MFFKSNYFTWKLCYEGEGDPGSGGNPDPTKEKKFTQDEVNSLLAKDKRKLKEDNEKLTLSLKEMQEKFAGNQDVVNDLQGKIDEIENKSKSEVTLIKEENDKLKKAHQKEKEDLLKERDGYHKLFTDHKIETEIMAAAINGEAFSPMQVHTLLANKAKLNKKEDGSFAVEIEFNEIKDGQTQKLILSPTETIKRMKETPDIFGNLFKSGVKGGVGGGNSTDGKVNLNTVVSDPAKYRENRKQIRDTVGVK
jgi:hypothetical protein